MVIPRMSLYLVGQHGQFFTTRRYAERIRADVEALLRDGGNVMLDFIGVEAVTGQFADELVGVLADKYPHRISYTGVNEELEETIAGVLCRRAAQGVAS